MNKLIVFEGLDGAGKSTQIKLLKSHFIKNKLNFEFLHFPRLTTEYAGSLIAKFLRGELGTLEQIDTYLIAYLFAADRNEEKGNIQKWLDDGKIVVIDRYVYSNIAFQCAKIAERSKKEDLEKWILNLEYDKNKLPSPVVSFFLRVPIDSVQERLLEKRSGDDRTYLNNKSDIHEKSIDLQIKVDQEYMRLSSKVNDLKPINCFDSDNKLLNPIEISDKISKEIFDIIMS